MSKFIKKTNLKSSWTKYDIVKLIDIVAENDLDSYISGKKGIDGPVLKNFLGVKEISENPPSFWNEIQKHPKQVRLFALIAVISTHYSMIEMMAEYANEGTMSGVWKYEKSGKQYTNLRSALIISGASLQNYRRSTEVPYTFETLFENGDVGLLIKLLFINRLVTIGYSYESLVNDFDVFIEACNQTSMIESLALTKSQFMRWTSGESLDKKKEVFSISKLKIYSELPMLRVNQWLNEWDDVDFDQKESRNKPKPHFYTFSIDARLLKRLSDVHRRDTADRTSVQRKKSDARVKEINSYIEGGFPWSTLSIEQQKIEEHSKLKMPGLLPTAIIINILAPNTKRRGHSINEQDCLVIKDQLNDHETWEQNKKVPFPTLNIPEHIFSDDWDPELKPIEIIDGQHRLWAFDENQNFNGNYELPVIAFDNLDKAWQAYLFYTINIKPVRINTSLGFDLYPMLRTQRWLEASNDGVLAYRESRAQELVEALWLFPESPWCNRINMLGESGGATMSQAAFVRTFINSFFRQNKGLFSCNLLVESGDPQVLSWNRAQQAAFIIIIWMEIKKALKKNKELSWANALRTEGEQDRDSTTDLAFEGRNTFLARDQGVRSIMVFANDFFFTLMNESIFNLNEFILSESLDERTISNESILLAIELFRANDSFQNYVELFSQMIITIDWRTPSAVFDNDEERKNQLIYKGSGGYSEYYRNIKAKFEESSEPSLTRIITNMT